VIARFSSIVAALVALAYPAIVSAQTGDTAVSGALDRAFGQMAGAGGEPLSL
jgi:flagellar biosynthetic protein FliP